MMPMSKYQSDLIMMAQRVVFLWSWDPSPEESNRSKAVTAANYGTSQGQSPQPRPIYHPSRKNTTFASMRPHITFSGTNVPLMTHHLIPQANSDSVPNRSTFELPSSKILVEEDFELISELRGGSSGAQDIKSKPCNATSLADILDWLTHVEDSKGLSSNLHLLLPPHSREVSLGV